MGAKVNGKMVPLRYKLKNGEIVEIITSARQHPSKDWLEFVKSPRARTKIRQWVKNQEREESIHLGKNILEKALKERHLTIPNIIRSEQFLAVANEFSFHSTEDLIAEIGFGKISPKQVIGRLEPRLGLSEEKHTGIMTKMVDRLKRRKAGDGITVKGVRDMLIRFANCCHPLPGEAIIGFISRGRGITIHNKTCHHVQQADPERLVEVSWEPTKDDIYLARLKVTSIDKKGILADISSIIAQKDINIIQAEVKTTVDQKGISLFTVEVGDYTQLKEIIGAIKKVENVLMVERL
jgi:guanosine-3',5'-bis(diphosphate) 3'-pyrophosphohydrolase